LTALLYIIDFPLTRETQICENKKVIFKRKEYLNVSISKPEHENSVTFRQAVKKRKKNRLLEIW